MKAFIGIDPSINSTGMVIRLCDDSLNEVDVKYYIFKGDEHKVTKKTNKVVFPLTRAEIDAQDKYENFNYILYDKKNVKVKGASIENEYYKTQSLIFLVEKINEVINTVIAHTHGVVDDIYVVIEGISYGSTIKTSSVFDLAGLNYLIRKSIMTITNNIIISPPSHIKKFATGMGNAKKDLIIDVFKTLHPLFDIPKIDDIADAFFMSRLSQYYLESGEFEKFR